MSARRLVRRATTVMCLIEAAITLAALATGDGKLALTSGVIALSLGVILFATEAE